VSSFSVSHWNFLTKSRFVPDGPHVLPRRQPFYSTLANSARKEADQLQQVSQTGKDCSGYVFPAQPNGFLLNIHQICSDSRFHTILRKFRRCTNTLGLPWRNQRNKETFKISTGGGEHTTMLVTYREESLTSQSAVCSSNPNNPPTRHPRATFDNFSAGLPDNRQR
jgi:hypothetical protein